MDVDKRGWFDRLERDHEALPGLVFRDDSRMYETKLTEISIAGCRLTGDYEVGEQLSVHFEPVGYLRTEVLWSVGGTCGVRFYHPTRGDDRW